MSGESVAVLVGLVVLDGPRHPLAGQPFRVNGEPQGADLIPGDGRAPLGPDRWLRSVRGFRGGLARCEAITGNYGDSSMMR